MPHRLFSHATDPKLVALAGLASVALAGGALAGCTPSIGDDCTRSTDCSLRNDRVCDRSQPGGYCTITNCTPNSCPDKAACTLFNAAVPGCGYDDRSTFRTGKSYCMARCGDNSDCRDGYVCADPRNPPWNAVILDDDQVQLVCLVAPSVTNGEPDPNAPVCKPGGNRDAAATPIDASPPTLDGGDDAASDAQDDAPDAGTGDALGAG